jgi:8-oxo-dGTP pyrophosphatase MutT (NUDIX family)
LASVDRNNPAPQRAAIEDRLRGTSPGGDPLAALLSSLPADQHDLIRQAVPANLARAAVLVPIVDRPDGLTVLLTLRASHLKHHAGQISFPGGRIEAHDRSAWEAALRESEEEIGLAREFVTLAGYLPDQMVISGYNITPAVAFVRPGFELRLDTTEVEDVFEVPLAFVLDPLNHLPQDRHYQGITLVTYEMPYQGRRIWGATAQMLISLYRLLQES